MPPGNLMNTNSTNNVIDFGISFYFKVLDLSSATGWVDFFKAPTFNKNGSQFVYIAPQLQKEVNDSYQHLTLVSVDSGKETPLTSGEFCVLDILHWSEDTNTIFYAANAKNASYVKHIWSVQVNAPNEKQCLTCNISRAGVQQTYFSAKFSSDGKHAVISDDGPSLPRTDVVRLSSHNSCNFFYRFFLFVSISTSRKISRIFG